MPKGEQRGVGVEYRAAAAVCRGELKGGGEAFAVVLHAYPPAFKRVARPFGRLGNFVKFAARSLGRGELFGTLVAEVVRHYKFRTVGGIGEPARIERGVARNGKGTEAVRSGICIVGEPSGKQVVVADGIFRLGERPAVYDSPFRDGAAARRVKRHGVGRLAQKFYFAAAVGHYDVVAFFVVRGGLRPFAVRKCDGVVLNDVGTYMARFAIGRKREFESVCEGELILAVLIAFVVVVPSTRLISLRVGFDFVVLVTCRQYGEDQRAARHQKCCKKKERLVFALNFFHILAPYQNIFTPAYIVYAILREQIHVGDV